MLIQAKLLLPNPFGRGYPCPIRRFHIYHAVGGADGTTIVMMLVGLLCWGQRAFTYYSYCRNPIGWEFFVATRTHMGIAVNRYWLILATIFNQLCLRLITFLVFVCCQCLIAKNVCKLFSSYQGIPHFYAACCIDELSRGSNSGWKVTWFLDSVYRKLAS